MRWLCEAADEGGGGGVDHFHTYCLADLGFAARENCGFILARAAYHLLLAALCHALHEYVEDFADIGFVRGKRQLSCRAIIRLRRSIFTSSLMLSGIVRAASVPGRSEYLNIKEESKPTSRISSRVCSKSSSLSP